MINLNEEALAKAKKAKSVEELLTLAEKSGVDMTTEQAQEIFARLNQKSGELADDELDNVAGGGCYTGEGNLVVSAGYVCNLWQCNKCGNTEVTRSSIGRKKSCPNPNCDSFQACPDCVYGFSQAGLLLCSNPRYK